jgi:hypothetical protein
MFYTYLVRQDGAQFYLYDGSALEAILSYPGRVRDFDMTRAQQARDWFENTMKKWGVNFSFEK